MELPCLILIILCVIAHAAGECAVERNERWKSGHVIKQLMSMTISGNNVKSDANPLIALRLVRQNRPLKEVKIFQQLRRSVAIALYKGLPLELEEAALDLMAFKAACQDPMDFYGHHKNVNLVKAVADKLLATLGKSANAQTPLFSDRGIAFGTLALCLENYDFPQNALNQLLQFNNYDQQLNTVPTDTLSLAILASTCLERRVRISVPHKTPGLESFLKSAVKKVLSQVHSSGIIGNLDSTAIAVQALVLNWRYYPKGAFDCMPSIHKLLHEITQKSFKNTLVASQVAMTLAGKTYMDINKPACHPKVLLDENVTPDTLDVNV
ncbi:transcobalamin-2-like [Protopterus annectens]|uniref:transcobalamin-2-like n=1 Tax=Protopterus annectens TaxID=7888 RepID=UPI001CFAA97B|nr:transcobalamin-2-like [Protopterus annectens]